MPTFTLEDLPIQDVPLCIDENGVVTFLDKVETPGVVEDGGVELIVQIKAEDEEEYEVTGILWAASNKRLRGEIYGAALAYLTDYRSMELYDHVVDNLPEAIEAAADDEIKFRMAV